MSNLDPTLEAIAGQYNAILADPAWQADRVREWGQERHYETMSTDDICDLRVDAGALLADPPWNFQTRSDKGKDRSPEKHYDTLTDEEIANLRVQIEALPAGEAKALAADPPWRYGFGYAGTGGVQYQYPTLTTNQIGSLPVGRLGADDSVLFLWVTMPKLPDGLRVMTAWGYTFKTTAWTWVKLNPKDGKPFSGIGYWSSSNCEICLLGTRGHPKRRHKDVKQLILERGTDESVLVFDQWQDERLLTVEGEPAGSPVILTPRREHSRKPDEVYERIERLVEGPYVELFSRTRRPNWLCLGNQLDKFDPATPPEPNDPRQIALPFDYAALAQ